MLEANKQAQAKMQLKAATLDDYPRIQNLARFYVYDMSGYCGYLPGWVCPENDLYKSYDFRNYFTEPKHYPFLIQVAEELAGFVLINKQGLNTQVEWNTGEFFILAKFQHQGLGQQVAQEI